MNGLFDGMFSITAAIFCFSLLFLFVILKLAAALVVSWWWIFLPIGGIVFEGAHGRATTPVVGEGIA